MINVAILGCGYIGGFADDSGKRPQIYSHAKAISSMENLKLISCCDTDKTQLEKFSKRWSVDKKYSDLKEMLLNEKIDILVISTPTKFHYENIVIAADFPLKAIFCEKPLTYDTKSSTKIIKLCKTKNKILAVNFMRRWDSFYLDCKKILQSGELGEIHSIVSYVDTALYMNSIHMLDIINFFAGDIRKVYGKIDEFNETRVVDGKPDPGAYIVIIHKNQIISFIKASGETKKNHFFEIDIQCSKGRLRMLDDGERYEVYKFKPCKEKKWLSQLVLERIKENDFSSERLINAYQNILSTMEGNGKINSDGESSIKSLEIIEEVYKGNLK